LVQTSQFSGGTAASYLEGVQFGTKHCSFSGGTAASYLEGVQTGPNFGPNIVALVGAVLLCIWKGCSSSLGPQINCHE